ncbi:MAG: trypsin-like peptidase domain-containing protein, partial [Clostridia bacterium]|nr:trypsin-like peptidase domain-containing protein [Clostridia bacterium]
MKNTNAIKLSIIVLMIMTVLLSGCSDNNDNRNVVYDDMKTAFEQTDLLSSNIGIFSKTEKDGNTSYGECGSGVIIKKEGGMYYALTAAHVVSVPDSQLIVFTVNTEMKMDNIPGLEDFSVLSQETYESMYNAEVLYKSSRDDLAVIRFSCDEELSVAELADSDPKIGDRIMCIGNPQNDFFAVSYGKVTSGMERFGEAQGYPSNVMRHTAYIQVGSSGGAAFNEQLRLCGITPGASISPNGKKFYHGVLI